MQSHHSLVSVLRLDPQLAYSLNSNFVGNYGCFAWFPSSYLEQC